MKYKNLVNGEWKESNNEIEEMKSNRLSQEQREIALSKMTAGDGLEIF